MGKEVKAGCYIHTMTDEEVKAFPFIKDGSLSFYRHIAEKATGRAYETIQNIDCRLINVSENIQASWYEQAKEDGIGSLDLTVLLAQLGPKCSRELEDNQIEICPRCIEIEEGVFYEPDRDSGKGAA